MTTPYGPPDQPGPEPTGGSLTTDPPASTIATEPSSSVGGSSASSSGSQTPPEVDQGARHVQDSARQAAGQVAGTARDQAATVAEDVRAQTRRLASETGQQVNEQAVAQRDRAVSALRSLGDELGSMSTRTEQPGLGAQLANQGATLSHQAADFLQERDPGQLLDEVRQLARRRPGTFLIAAAAAGAVVGRMTRGAISARSSGDGGGDATSAAATGHQPSGVTGSVQRGGMDRYGTEEDIGTSGVSVPGQGQTVAPSRTAAQAAPLLDEPYGEQPPPSGYSTSGGRP